MEIIFCLTRDSICENLLSVTFYAEDGITDSINAIDLSGGCI